MASAEQLRRVGANEPVVTTAETLLADDDAWHLVAHGLTLGVVEGLEKYRWVLCAQMITRPEF